MTNAMNIETGFAEGDRVYTTEIIVWDNGHDTPSLPAGAEGTVTAFTGDDAHDLWIEWDAGFMAAASSSEVALVI